MMEIKKIRVSIGSASVLGLISSTFSVPPTTCYIMTYRLGKCSANCGFCPQARSSDSSTEKLSRIQWPDFPFNDFLMKLKYVSPLKKFKRLCIQTLNYSENIQDLIKIISQIKKVSDIPISVAISPVSKEHLKELKHKGVERVGIALDGATIEVFNEIKGKDIKGPYKWETHFQCLKDALEVFSEGKVSTHIIVGLGETEKEILKLIEKLNSLKILPGLFAFSPIKGTKFENMEQPKIIKFRKMQLGHHLILKKNKKIANFAFSIKGDLVNFNINEGALRDIVDEGKCFTTSGCPGCNRPYYTSRPSGPTFNYPRKLETSEKDNIYNSLLKFLR